MIARWSKKAVTLCPEIDDCVNNPGHDLVKSSTTVSTLTRVPFVQESWTKSIDHVSLGVVASGRGARRKIPCFFFLFLRMDKPSSA